MSPIIIFNVQIYSSSQGLDRIFDGAYMPREMITSIVSSSISSFGNVGCRFKIDKTLGDCVPLRVVVVIHKLYSVTGYNLEADYGDDSRGDSSSDVVAKAILLLPQIEGFNLSLDALVAAVKELHPTNVCHMIIFATEKACLVGSTNDCCRGSGSAYLQTLPITRKNQVI